MKSDGAIYFTDPWTKLNPTMERKRLRASWVKKSANGWAWQRGFAVLGEVKKLIAVSDTPKAPEKNKSGKKAEVANAQA